MAAACRGQAPEVQERALKVKRPSLVLVLEALQVLEAPGLDAPNSKATASLWVCFLSPSDPLMESSPGLALISWVTLDTSPHISGPQFPICEMGMLLSP